jgi:hypothetical protein
MKKALGLVAILGAIVALAGITRMGDSARAAPAREDLVLSPGDTIRVDGAPLGCRVTRLARYGKGIFLDCRRAGRLAGSYGTYLGVKDVLVVRFLDSRKAKVVLHAEHERGATRCN